MSDDKSIYFWGNVFDLPSSGIFSLSDKAAKHWNFANAKKELQIKTWFFYFFK